ncbi:hypothetical protein ACFYOV_13675 [Streptomyces sp. NPDC005931]|uniref:hypothetical protein n=1 Tax=Streptomyces sp. NPDC005931 TaxID=3364737 RepID=UPI003679E15C
MKSTDYPTAWEHPPSRWAWVKHMTMNTIGLVGWGGGWVLLLGISTEAPNWFVWVFMPYFLYGAYRVTVQLIYFPSALHMLRVLRAYPWQVLHGSPRGIDQHPDAEDRGIWIMFPDPSGGSQTGIPLTFVKHHRSYWWLRRIGGPRTKVELKRQLEPLWFAGDPRFLGVVAVPAGNGRTPRRLHFLYQPSALDPRAPRRHWDGLNPADLERARRAGARFVVAVPPAVTGRSGREGTES